ncbi:hypothetical protein SELMODRAFT_231062 [Selaginella moellendorffii]|uniref:Major facilitator superfamily (MFS) profile domain-containing protein n=1 Tax=Selaginella moellendorffii TaxID=88036 RepID=D8R9L5_SELML|nr:hypothetical protein SELMODRAFT_231062 [Selaginella moellendorffii]
MRSLLTSEFTKDGSVDLLGRPSVRRKTGGWRACPFILGNECSERLAFYGINTNLVTYLIKEYHQGNAIAAKNVTIWSGTGYVTPILGAFLADAYWGRYRTIAVFSCLYLVGLILLTLSASLPSLKPPSCDKMSCQHASLGQLIFFYVSLYFVALGMGGIKPCISAFGADQFDNSDPVERKNKGHFFNWFYLSINVGGLVATTCLVYIQDNTSWALGFGIPAACMAVSIGSFLLGSPLYRHQRPQGSPLVRVAQVLVAAFRKCFVQEQRKLPRYSRFLDKAAVNTGSKKGTLPGPWKLCPVSQVDEVKTLLRILPIWATLIIFTTVYSQISTTFIEQGSRMDTNILGFKISPASMSTFEILTVILMVPIYDRILIKLARRVSGHPQGFTQLQRMGIGLAIGILSMVVASATESKRLELARTHKLVDDAVKPVPMTVVWQLPQIVILGIAETFTYIGQLEFFYEQAPDSMRSLGTAVALTTFGLGNYLNGFLIMVVSRVTSNGGSSPGWIPDNLNLGHLNFYYDLLAFLSACNLVWYLIFAKAFKYRESSGRTSCLLH